jgi:parallel beta-helix repeat protein
VSGVTVNNSNTGISLTGSLDGTRIQGNTFNANGYALQLTTAQRALIGGSAVDQRNTIAGATRAGLFARGFCTGTQVIGTVFTASPRTRTRFNVRSSRNLRISGTIVERTPAPARSTATVSPRVAGLVGR